MKAFESEIFELARSLAQIVDQSHAALKPLVDDACRHPETLSQSELERLFDYVLDISSYPKGKRLFNRLCRRFKTIYPESVQDYIRIQHEQDEE